MPALPKPHRIAFLPPDLRVEGNDAVYEREVAALVWVACIEACQRHQRLSVLDADAMPLLPQDGHFVPSTPIDATRPLDAWLIPARRDEVLWLELAIGGKPGAVRLHSIARDGTHESFDALGPKLGEQIDQVLGAWLSARKLGALPRRFEDVSGDDLLAIVRVIAPTLIEHARAWTLPAPSAPTFSLAEVAADAAAGDAEGEREEVDEGDVLDEAPALESTIDSTLDQPADGPEPADERRRSLARPLVQRLPAVFRVPALRLIELALREELPDAVLAADPQQPQALFARVERGDVAPGPDELALVRKINALAPGWSRPYEHLAQQPSLLGTRDVRDLQQVAASGMAATCRPGDLATLAAAGEALAAAGRLDEGIRMLERAVRLDPEDPRTHRALLALFERSDRPGAWLAQALRSAAQHGCPDDPVLPWYPDQISMDLAAATALLHVGRLDEAILLRATRLAARETSWPAPSRALAGWKTEPRFVAWCYAREGGFRGDDARVLEGFGRVAPADDIDLALYLDALVALGLEAEAPLAWARFGLARETEVGPLARLAAARALMAAGAWREGLDELWRAELTAPGRDEHVTIARTLLVVAAAPIEVVDAAISDRLEAGAVTLARRMARDIADFVPLAAKSDVVARALGKSPAAVEFDPAWLAGFGAETRSRRAIDQLFADLGSPRKGAPSGFDIADELARGDRLVARWLEIAFAEAAEDDRAALAQAAAYTAAQALARYFAATTAPASPIAGALRTVAGEAFALVRRYRTAVADRDARALLGALEPAMRKVDRWIATTWLDVVERSLALDERCIGDLAGFARDFPTAATRLLGPEEAAVLAWSIAKLHREHADGWATKVAAHAQRLATYAGRAALDEWADAISAQPIDAAEAIDALHTAAYLAEGLIPGPCVAAAHALFAAGRGEPAFAVLRAGMPMALSAWRDKQLAELAPAWKRAGIDVPIGFAEVATGVLDALGRGDAARAERFASWAVAIDPTNEEAHRNLGLALAKQGKVAAAMHQLTLADRERAPQLLASALVQAERNDDAIAVIEHASRMYTHAEEWLSYGELAYAANDLPRAAAAYARAHRLDPAAFDASQREAYESMQVEHTAADAQIPPPPTAPSAEAVSPWRMRRLALYAARFRRPAESHLEVTPAALAAANAVLADSAGSKDREALLARSLALALREQAYFARDPAPRLGQRMTREEFQAELVRRGGVLHVDDTPASRQSAAREMPSRTAFVDREVVPGSKVARVSDYIALLRDLAALAPRDALAQFDLDDAGYLEIARAWGAAMDTDPSIAHAISAGLAGR